MSTVLLVIGLILGSLILLALVATPFVVRFARRFRAAREQLSSEIQHETVLLPLQKGTYRGATAPGYPAVKNSGQMALTRRRLVFLTYTGKTVSVALNTVTGLRQSSVFKASVMGGWKHLIVRTNAGEVGFFTHNNAVWLAALEQATGITPDPTD